MATNSQKVDVYSLVTERIINELQNGIIPWQRPWTGLPEGDGGAINYVTRKPYSFLNQMLLGKPGEWLSWKQIQELKGTVRKGSHGSMVVFYTMQTYVKKDKEGNPIIGEDGKEEVGLWPILRYYNVFHLDDVGGIESKLPKEGEEKPEPKVTPIDAAEVVINGYLEREEGLKFINGSPCNKAYYSPSEDKVQVPMMSQFPKVEEYYSTTFHELTHSTIPQKRCNRVAENANAFFGNKDYSREELVAEMGAAMLCNRVGIDCAAAFKNSVAYIQSWLEALKNDKKMVVWAASRAAKASMYILNETEAEA